MPVPADLAAFVTDADVARGELRALVDLSTGLLESGLDLALLLVLALGAPGRRLWDACLRLGARTATPMLDRVLGAEWKAAVLFGAALGFGRELVGLPIAFSRDFAFYRHLGLSTETLGRFLSLWALDAFGAACALAPMCAVLAVVRRRWRRWWLLVGVPAALVLVASAVVEPLWMRVSYDVEPLAAGPLRTRLEAQLAAHGEVVEDLVTIDASRYGSAVNAFIGGFGPTRRIVLTDSLVALGDDAVAGAVMHEIGHRRGERLPVRLGVACVGLVLLLRALDWLLGAFRRRGSPSDAVALAGALAVLSVAWLAYSPVQAAFQRAEEREADEVELAARTDYDAYVTSQITLMRANALVPDPAPWARLLATHPSPADRMRRALWYKTRVQAEKP